MTGAAEDNHTLDEYMDALKVASLSHAARIGAVRRLVWGGRGNLGREHTAFALEELAEQGRAVRRAGCRYRPATNGSSEPSPPVHQYAPERVIADAKALAERLSIARARLKARLDQRLEVVSRERAMLAELDRYVEALGGES